MSKNYINPLEGTNWDRRPDEHPLEYERRLHMIRQDWEEITEQSAINAMILSRLTQLEADVTVIGNALDEIVARLG
jgi:hypothetical protein